MQRWGSATPSDVADRLDTDEITLAVVEGGRKTNLVNESGLYEATFGSRKERAARFKRWVRKDVLPSIREDGQLQHTARPGVALAG